jgi:hypothetical protein
MLGAQLYTDIHEEQLICSQVNCEYVTEESSHILLDFIHRLVSQEQTTIVRILQKLLSYPILM